MIVDILKENRYLVAEHVELDHPLSKGDAVIMKRGEGDYEFFNVVHCQQTIYVPSGKTYGRVVNIEIIVCGELSKNGGRS